jgi:histidine kinase
MGARVPDARATATMATPRALPSFWVLHVGGWLAYGAAMMLSRLGSFPLSFMVVAKGILMVSGFLLSLGLRYAYRPLVRRGTPLITLVVTAVVASYLVSMVWTAVDNLIAVPLYTAFDLRPPVFRSVLQVFSGTVYNAFTMLAWSVLYIGIRYYGALQEERERSLRAEATAHQAQLEALRYQINPHFLFNSLNAVSTLVTERRNDEAAIDDGPGVRDDGNGSRNGAGRIGLANTRDGLGALYGDRGRLELSTGNGGGTRATVEIPFRRQDRSDRKDLSGSTRGA